MNRPDKEVLEQAVSVRTRKGEDQGSLSLDAFIAQAKEEIENILSELESISYGTVLRAKGIVKGVDEWIHFDYVPGEADVRSGGSSTIGRICVIGANINEEKLSELFRI